MFRVPEEIVGKGTAAGAIGASVPGKGFGDSTDAMGFLCTSCGGLRNVLFRKVHCLARIAASCRNSCFPLNVYPWTFLSGPSTLSHPFALFLLILPSPGGALPSDDSSPNAISLTCPSAYTHCVQTRTASGQTGKSSIPDSGHHKAMGLSFSLMHSISNSPKAS